MTDPTASPPHPLDALFAYAVRRGASDLHLKVPSRPAVRVHGRLEQVRDHAPLTPAATEAFAAHLFAAFPDRAEEFARCGDTDMSYAAPGIGRFRVNVFRQRGSVSMVARVVPFRVPSLDELFLPPAVARLAAEERGIVLVTGTTGSGKSTTLAAMIDRINSAAHKHVVTIEDPIEILHRDRTSLINQREVGLDTADFRAALRRVLRQDPDVIMIGEIRDEVTMETALNAAETGHLVLSTMHTINATETVNRAIGFFPLHQQAQVRHMLAGTLRGVVSQRLVPRSDGTGRVPAVEVMVTTGRARDAICNPDETGRLGEIIREGDFYGMQTFDQSLFGLVTDGLVSLDAAIEAATSPHDFKLMLEAGVARRTTSQYAGGG
ncbi:MAG TPA: PilT/PilU family type 4a pilus ATPase [Miltoncostaeaceae bacterium]|nr:PilT/PilU family type 4a pilus ATPase [Miltoncostaeaceae bacterium]